jgi:hypothetical protein
MLNICLNVKTNLIDPAHPIELDRQEVSERTFGSKMILLLEQCMCAVQWGTKACLLLLYWRLTQNLTQNIIVKCTAAYVGITYVVMLICYFAVWCRPFHDYWEVPTSNMQCPTALNHLIMNLVFNLSSDLLILSIPLPLLIKAKLELKKKILLVFPFSLGFFTMICAILSKRLSFTNPYSSEWVFWYCREASTAMIVTNMPYSWSLIRKIFNLKSFLRDSSNDRQDSRAHSMGDLGYGRTGYADRKASRQTSNEPTVSSHHTISLKPPFWRYGPSKDRHSSGAESQAAIIEAGRRNTDTTSIDKELEIHAAAASSSSGSIRKPANAASAAVDKLYRLDDFDDDDLERGEIPQRGYNGG